MAQPALCNSTEALQCFKDTGADVTVVAAYGLTLPHDVLDTPKHRLLSISTAFHVPLRLARHRFNVIEAGDAETGGYHADGYRFGHRDVVREHRYAIQPTDTANEAHDALMGLGVRSDCCRLQRPGRLKAV